MLVNLQYAVQAPFDERGVSIKSEPREFEAGIKGDLYTANYDPYHPFWSEKFDPEKDRNTCVMSVLQTRQPGIICGYHIEHAIDNFTNHRVKEDFGMINLKDGLVYTHDDYVHMLPRVHDPVLPSGRIEPAQSHMVDMYGSADNLKQILHKFRMCLMSTDKYVLSYHPVLKSDQSPDGGYRFHKNGEYIGNKRSKHNHEYLYDEPKIDHILQYHWYKVEEV